MDLVRVDWIAVDWGTTNMRVWAMGGDDEILARVNSDRGMGTLNQAEFEPALLELIAPWLHETDVTDVVACGMVGARQGWVEAPYGAVPCEPFAGESVISFSPLDQRLRMHIIAGLSQAEPADVMRGEETQIAGLLAGDQGFKGVICLPGTHTKWAWVEGGKITKFSTHMTGELFSLLAENSVLRHTIASKGWDDAEFSKTFNSALENPVEITAHLFSLRAEALISDLLPEVARARLSALLLGLEFAAMRTNWQGQKIAIIGSDRIAKIYQQAFLLQNEQPIMFDAEALTLGGLINAHRQLQLKELK